MAIDLQAQIRLRGRRRKSIVVDMPRLPRRAERELAAMYLKAIRIWNQRAVEEILAEYEATLREMTDSISSVRAAIRRIEERKIQAILLFAREYMGWAEGYTRQHFRALVRKLKYATNIDISSQIGAAGNQMTIQALLERNVGLVVDISDQARQRISDLVYAGLTNRTPVDVIARDIRKATGMAADRARRVASDQAVKLSSALDAERLRELGEEGYEWQHSGKVHYRPEHKERDGDFIKFGSEIDLTDPPGYAPFCGCKRRMRMNFEDW